MNPKVLLGPRPCLPNTSWTGWRPVCLTGPRNLVPPTSDAAKWEHHQRIASEALGSPSKSLPLAEGTSFKNMLEKPKARRHHVRFARDHRGHPAPATATPGKESSRDLFLTPCHQLRYGRHAPKMCSVETTVTSFSFISFFQDKILISVVCAANYKTPLSAVSAFPRLGFSGSNCLQTPRVWRPPAPEHLPAAAL